ncbi:hypothetical protein [Chroococcidiopsis sp. SAG 2025]|uniref:hypothetical protein n=1 Tax=Chroococcidiopsis sp. SAG 2025 TaxID=171389 RepID=UPI0029373F36|nr:hypothetical protein [Chroococcidiopsis sp. SAG 2025]
MLITSVHMRAQEVGSRESGVVGAGLAKDSPLTARDFRSKPARTGESGVVRAGLVKDPADEAIYLGSNPPVQELGRRENRKAIGS